MIDFLISLVSGIFNGGIGIFNNIFNALNSLLGGFLQQ